MDGEELRKKRVFRISELVLMQLRELKEEYEIDEVGDGIVMALTQIYSCNSKKKREEMIKNLQSIAEFLQTKVEPKL